MCGRILAGTVMLLTLLLPSLAGACLPFGPEQRVQASGLDMEVSAYSMPEAVDWNGDGLFDILVGEGSSTDPVMLRIYLNVGAPGAPLFGAFSYLQYQGEDFVYEGG